MSESANSEKPRGFVFVTSLLIVEAIVVLWLIVNTTIEGSYGWYPEYITLLALEIASVAGVVLLRKWGAVVALVAQGIYLEHALYIVDDLLFYPENFAGTTDAVSYAFLAALSILMAIIIVVYFFKWLTANRLK